MPTRFRRGVRMAFRWLFGRNAPQEPWWAEMWSAVATVGWGAWGLMMNPPFSSIPAFRLVLWIVDHPDFWFATALFLGVWQMLSLRHFWSQGRWWAAFALAWFWVGLTITTAMADTWTRPGLSLYLVIALINLHSVLRLRVEPPP